VSAGLRRTRGTSRIPLRIALVALLVALVAVALIATGFAATSLLRTYLLQQQDDQLNGQLQQAQADPFKFLNQCVGRPDPIPAPNYIGCLHTADSAEFAVAAPYESADRPDVANLSTNSGGEADGGPGGPPGPGDARFGTVTSMDGHHAWRVATANLPGGWTAVVGSDLGRDEDLIGRLVRIEVLVGVVVLAVLGATGYLLVHNSLRPLREVEDTARAIAGGDLSQRVPEGDERTEVGRLSTALNGMLSRIESSFRAQQASEEQARSSETRMRRFVADASHELRTPLTSIRGFAELYRQGAVGTPEETRRLMQRIEAEGARMGLLVEDLLMLARLDQQRPLSITPVDLAELAGDAVHDARAVQPDRPIALHLDDSLTDVPVVLGDEGRLRQVIGNLVTNALTHTPPDTRVTVTLAEEAEHPDMVVLRVADRGPGLAREDAARVFERFYRADASRTREEGGGTGLGLAIVASLVAAHGGSVDVVTGPGEGATFVVRLPRSGPDLPGPAQMPSATMQVDEVPFVAE
jgi:signal transduction histidine kinase